MPAQRGFTLIELIAVMILVGVMSVTLFSRLGSINTTNVQASRDDLIAALFFAQQTAMARSGIQLVVTANTVSVTENLPPVTALRGYPLSLPSGITATPTTFSYDKLGRTTARVITLTSAAGNATITVEESGYAR
ncbi:MAG: type II secretion system protein [Pseudomonadota bacterium]